VRRAILLMMLLLLTPVSAMVESPYIGTAELIVTPAGDGTLVNLSEDSFEVPANATILDGWVNISTGADGDGGTGRHWIADDPAGNFSHGTLSAASLDVFETELTLGVNHTVGRLDDLETLSLRFQHYTPGGAANVWRMAEPSQFNGSFAMNYSARQAAGGLIPSLATQGALVAATLPEDPLPAGTYAWLTSDVSPVPVMVNDWKISFNHWYHLNHVNASTGSSGAWLEVSLDSGSTWQWVEPATGYTWNISTTAPLPNGAPGPGFGVFGGPDASGWVNSTFDLSNLNTANATGFAHRFVVWTDPAGQVDRPGWYVDEVTISNAGQTPGSWFHGSLTGEYAQDAGAHLTLPVQMNTSNVTSGAWMLRYWTDFDLEGGTYDNFEVFISSDNLSWHRLSPVGGIPGPYGLTVAGRTILQDSEGWVEVAHPFPAAFTVPANGSVLVRFEVETDPMPSSGYGGLVDPPEGVFIDDLSITRTISSQTTTLWTENLTTDAQAFHGRLPGASYDQWQHLVNWGNNGPWQSAWSFEGAPEVADGWVIHTTYGQSWAFGNISNATGWGPSAWPSGSVGAAMGLAERHASNSWSHLISPTYHIPPGASARVAFDHYICAEPDWDGGALYTSVDNGSTWQIFGQNIAQFYDRQHWNNAASPFYQKWVWDGSNQKGGGCGANKSFTHVEGDLSSFGGQDVMLRFSFFSDDFIELDGWYIDNVGVIVDWFETNGTWTSELLQAPTGRLAPSVDLDAIVPAGGWVEVDILDAQGMPSLALQDSPKIHSLSEYRIQIRFGTTDHQLTPRIRALHEGAVRVLSSADASNGWSISPALVQNVLESNLTNPSLLTQRISGEPAFGSAPIEAVTISAESAGALFELRDAKGAVLASGTLSNRTIQLAHPAVLMRVTIDLQPGGWVRHATFTGHLGLAMHNGTVDIGGDGAIDWAYSPATPGDGFGWTADPGTMIPADATEIDRAHMIVGLENATWDWADGSLGSISLGEVLLVTWVPTLYNLSGAVNVLKLGVSYSQTISITGLGPALRDIQADARNGTGPAQIITGQVHIPIVLSADQGGVALSGGITHAQRMVNSIISVPAGTMVPEQSVTIVSEHSHLFDRGLLDLAILRMQTSEGVPIEVHIPDLDDASSATQIFGADELTLTSVNIISVGADGYRIEWNLVTKWAFDDQAWIRVLAEMVEVDGFTLGPAHGQIGGSNHQAMENDLEVVSWTVRDEAGRLLSNTWDARYPLYAKAGSMIDVGGVVRFEGQSGEHPDVDSYRVALEVVAEDGTTQAMGVSMLGGGFEVSIELPTTPGNVTVSPWILQIGPPGVTVVGAEDASGGESSVEIRIDDAAPTVGPLMIHTPDGGRPADGNILSPNQMVPFWFEVSDAELLLSVVELHCWLEGLDDTDGDGVPDLSEYSTRSQFIGGVPRGTFRVDFASIPMSGMEDGDLISCFVTGGDYAGYDFIGGGTAGFDSDLATMVVELQSPTLVSLPSIDLDRHIDMSLLQGMKHTFSFSFVDANGLQSIDEIELDLAGDGLGRMLYDPLTGEMSIPEGSHLIALDVRTEDIGDDAYSVAFDFAIGLSAPVDWREGVWVPDLIITEDGALVSSGALDLAHLSWALDHRLMWVVDEAVDTTAPAMPLYENRLNLQPGDSMRLSASVVHRESGEALAFDLPPDSMIDLSIEGGTQPYAVEVVPEGGGFSTSLTFEEGNWPGPFHQVRFGLHNVSQWNTSLPDLGFEVAVDDVAPQIVFQSTSLVQLRSDQLSGRLISFSVMDAGGMGEQVLSLHWTYRRDGIDIAGASGSAEMGLGVHSGEQWVYSKYVDLTPIVGLAPGDQLLVWLEGSDLAGNALTGPATRDSPRVPALEIMHFTPGLVSVWVDPPKPEVGQMVRVDARVSNLGNLAGSLSVGLWAWESQSNGEDQIVRLANQNLSLEPHESLLLSFEFEAWRKGDLNVYLVVNEDPSSRLPVDVPPIREEGASLSFFERVFGDGPLALGLLIIACTALGFVGAILWLGREEEDDDAEWEEVEEEEEVWPEPPESFPDETPPPIPPGLSDDSSEEE